MLVGHNSAKERNNFENGWFAVGKRHQKIYSINRICHLKFLLEYTNINIMLTKFHCLNAHLDNSSAQYNFPIQTKDCTEQKYYSRNNVISTNCSFCHNGTS